MVLIDESRDGIDQIMAALAGRSELDAIHLVSHGAADRLMLGTTTIDAAGVNGKLAVPFAAIGAKLASGGDLLIYGCDVSLDDAGQSFIDATGAAALGGDWDLEARSGDVTATTLVSDRYAGLLQLTNPSTAWTISGNSGSTVIDRVTVTIAFTNGTGGRCHANVAGGVGG